MTEEVASIGLGLETDGIEKGIKALDVLASKGPAVEKSMAQVESSAKKTGKTLENLGRGTALDGIAQTSATAATGMEKLGASSAKAQAALSGQASATKNAAASFDSLKTAVAGFSQTESQYIQKLVDEAKQLGMNRSERERYIAQSRGMSESAQQVAAAVGAKIDAYKREQAELSKLESSANRSSKAISESLGQAASIAGRALAALGVATSVREFVKLADASTNVSSRLGLVTSSSADLASVQQRLFSIAQASRVNFVDLVGTYTQLARSTKDLGISQGSLLGVVKTVSQAVTISGGTAESARSALTQLAQGFASGALRGEELNSVLEQTPRLAQAIADGLGVSVGKLKELGTAGKLTAEQVLGALEKSAAGVAAEFGKMSVTVEQASIQAANSVLKLVGAFDRLFGITSSLAGAITTISSGLDFLSRDVEKLGSQGPLRDAAREVINLDAAAKRLRTGMQSGVLGPDAQGELDRINARLAEAKARFRELDQQLSGTKDPRDQSGFTGRGASYANEAKRQAKLREDANSFLLKQSGVPPGYVKDMEELIRLNEAGVIVGDKFTAAVKKQQEILLLKTGVTKGAAAAASQEQNTYESLTASIRAKIAANELELSGDVALTEAQRIRIKLDQDLAAGKIKLGSLREQEIRGDIARLEATDAEVAAKRTLAKANLDAAASREKYVASLGLGIEKIKTDIAAQIDATARMGLSKTAIADLDAAKLEMLATDTELQAIKALDRNLDQQTYDALKEQARLYRDLAEAKKGGAAKEASLDLEKTNKEAAKKAEEEWKRSVEKYDDIFSQGFADMLNNGKSGWKSFTKSLVTTFKTTVADQIYKMFLQPFVVNIVGNLMGISGALGGGGAGVGGGGGVMGIANAASTANSAYNLYQGGLSGLTAPGSMYYNFATSSIGKGIGLSNAAPIIGNNVSAYAPAGTQLTSAGSSTLAAGGAFVAVAALVLNALGAFKSDRQTGSGFQGTLGGTVSPYEEWREGGSLFSGPSSSKFNPLENLLDAQNHLRELQDIGAGDSDAALQYQQRVNALEDQYGDLITSAANSNKILQDSYDGMRKSAGDMADKLGLSSEAVRKFTIDLFGDREIELQGLAPAEQQAKFAEALALANNDLAEQVLGSWVTTTKDVTRVIEEGSNTDADMLRYRTETDSVTSTRYVASEYAKEGEKAIDTLTRLASSLGTVNTIWENLGYTVYEASLAGANSASTMADAFGGLDNMASVTGTYYDLMYSDAEKRANTARQISEALGKVELSLPNIDATDAQAQWRALAEAQDRSTEEGRNAYVTILQLTSAFVGITSESAAAADAVSDVTRTLRESLIGLESSFAGGGFSRQYRAEDAAGTVSGLLAEVGIQKDAGMLAQQMLSATSGEVEAYFREIWNVLDTDEARQKLVDVTGVMMDLAQGAGSAAEAFQKQQDALQTLAQDAARLFSARNSAGDLMDRISGAMGKQGTFGAQRESELWGALGSTRDAEKQVELASQLTDLVLSRQQLEVQNAERMLSFGRSLRGYVDGLKLGSLSPLTNAEKLAEASAQYNEMLGKVQGGDANAQAGLQGIASTYLDLARTYFAGNEQFGAIFGAVTSSLDALGVSSMSEAQQQLSLGTQSLGELQKLYGITETAYGSLNAQYETAVGELTAAQDALVLQSDSLDQLKDIAGLLSGLPAEIAVRLPAINTEATTYLPLTMPVQYGAQGDNAALIAELQALRKEVAELRAENRQDAQMVAGATVTSASASASQIADAAAKAAHTNAVKQGAVLV